MTGSHFSDDDVVWSGEYVLRLMGEAEMVAFETRLPDEPGLRLLVRDWQEGFAGLAADIAAVRPPRSVRSAVERRLFGGGRGWLFGWIGGAVAAAALALLVVTAVLRPDAPELVAEIAAEDRSLVVAAAIFPPEHVVRVELVQGTAPPGRVLELWVIADGQPGPLSLGILPVSGEAALDVPLAVQAANITLQGATLAISDEPPGGSPTGAPTGQVLAVGTIVGS